MNEYKINVIYNDTGDLNDIFERSLIKELKKYLSKVVCEKNKNGISLKCTYLDLYREGK